MTYRVLVSGPARRDLETRLPEAVAAAAVEFLYGALAQEPRRAGKALLPPRRGQHSARRGQYRIIYTVDDDVATVTVLSITHRRDAYRG